VLAITLITVGLALLLWSRQTPIYRTGASVLVTSPDLGAASASPVPLNMATEVQLMTSVQVADIVARRSGFTGDPRTLLDDLAVDNPTGTEILELTYRSPDPSRAQRLASEFASAYLQYRRNAAMNEVEQAAGEIELELDTLNARLVSVRRQLAGLPANSPQRATLEAQEATLVNIILDRELELFRLPGGVDVGRIIEPARLPSSPVGPNYVVAGALGLVAGSALAIGQAFLRERLSQRLRSSEEAEELLGAPVLGTIPRIPQWRRRKQPLLVSLSHQRSPATEAYRILRTSVLSAAAEAGVKSIVVTSAYAGEGKSATVANLGVVLARADKRVTLVSADLRRPRLHQFFTIKENVGLSDVLADRVPLGEAMRAIRLPTPPSGNASSGALRVLPSGPVPNGPTELLTPERIGDVLRAVEESSDIVLIDVPPVLAITDALVVAQAADGVLVVLGPNSVDRSSVISVRQQLDKVGARVLGGVLNGPAPELIRSDYYYY
jgi:non-specific protein-tyrosine kinase